MKKVLVTGSGGFVGRHLVDLLKTDYEVIGTLFGEDLKDQENVSYHEGNIQDPKFLEDLINKYSPDFIVHLAARAISWDSDTEQIFNTNFLGTINLYKAVIANRNKNPDYNPKILYVSSAEIYGKTTAPDKINEHCPFFPVNFYAVSKVAGDRLSYQLSQSEKLNILISNFTLTLMRKRGLAGSPLLYILAFLLIGGIIAGVAFFALSTKSEGFECDTSGQLKCKDAELTGISDSNIGEDYLLLEISEDETISSASVSGSSLSSEQCNPTVD